MFTHKRQQQADSLLDKFYTRPHIVQKCLDCIDLSRYDCVIEPSAGNGAFISEISHDSIIALDIDPKHSDILKQDWLSYEVDSGFKKVLVIGNPPFGLSHTLSDSFILHSLKFSNVQTIGFILPNTYNKHTRQRIIPPEWRISHIVDLGRDAFVYEGEIYHSPCSFFVFDRSIGHDLRFTVHEKMYKESIDFYFGDKNDYDFFIFGACPNKITLDPQSNNRGYYIKPKIEPEKVKNRLKAINWKGNSCANGGVAWFTKPEIVTQYDSFVLSNFSSSVPN